METQELPVVTGRHRNRALAKRRKTRAVELVLNGCTYQQTAEQMGYANRGTVHRIVTAALVEHQVETINDLRALELARLEALQLAYWDQAVSGCDLEAAAFVLKVSDRRARVLGLYESTGAATRSRRTSHGAASSDVDVLMRFDDDGRLVEQEILP